MSLSLDSRSWGGAGEGAGKEEGKTVRKTRTHTHTHTRNSCTDRQLQEEADVPVGVVGGGLQLAPQEGLGLVLQPLAREQPGQHTGCMEPHSLEVSCPLCHQHLQHTHT